MSETHLDPDRLAGLAVSGGNEPAHLTECQICRSDLAELRGVVASLRELPDPPAGLLDAAKAYFRRRRRLEDLIERLISDPALQERARTRPEAVLEEAGLEPVPELIEALRSQGRTSGDLARRIAAKQLWF